MKVAGVPSEFNPFHHGHEYLLRAVRARLGEDTAIVCAMSGNFAQRGECALYRKHARAEAAVRCGADLVLELPLPWALSSAEGFGQGMTEVLSATGIITHLCFGSESGDAGALGEAAEVLLRPEIDMLIRCALQSGVSYAAARQQACEALSPGAGELLTRPNDILGIEYIKALEKTNSAMEAGTISRVGARHDGTGDGVFQSAKERRRRCAAGEDISPLLPGSAAAVFRREAEHGRGPVTMETLETALLSRLRMLPPEVFDALPDASEGLGRRLYTAVREGGSLAAVLDAAKTKRYAASRLRRMLLCACLGLRAGDRDGGVPYLKVLALSSRGRALLREMRGAARLPVLTKPAAVTALSARARRIFSLEADAGDLYALGYQNPEQRRAGCDWRETPFVGYSRHS